jgi:hypothetical protein
MWKQAIGLMGMVTFAACASPSTESEASDVAVYEDGDGKLEVTVGSENIEVRYVDRDGNEQVAVFERGEEALAREFLHELRSPLLQSALAFATERASDADLWVIDVIGPKP